MQGYSPKLPLTKDNVDGFYAMNKTAVESIKQDLKMLLLTNPGERMMNPSYGVGIRRFLFSQATSEFNVNLESAINQQLRNYMSFIVVNNLEITNSEDGTAAYISLEYYISNLNIIDQLIFSVTSN